MRILLIRIYLGIEFALLFIGIPLFMYFDTGFIHPSIVLLPFLVFIILVLRFTTEFRFRELIYIRVGRDELKRGGLIVLVIGLLLLLGVLIFDRKNLFNLPRGNPFVWILLCTFYPIFSAYTQEVIFRTFLFRRYKNLFMNDWLLIVASGVTFSFVHILYYSAISMILTLFAGLYLAYVYSRTKSVLYSAILHGLFGIIVFTVGLGQYFWLDMFKWI